MIRSQRFALFSYHFFSRARYTAPVPKPNNNRQSKLQKVPRLSASDLCALRDFVNKRLTEPSSLQDNNPLPLSVLIDQNPDLYRNAVDLLSAGNSVQAVAQSQGFAVSRSRTLSPSHYRISDESKRGISPSPSRRRECK
jgi:hypothetical protein